VGKAQRAHADNTTGDATNGGHGHAAFAHLHNLPNTFDNLKKGRRKA
jgi:hypothetical protein